MYLLYTDDDPDGAFDDYAIYEIDAGGWMSDKDAIDEGTIRVDGIYFDSGCGYKIGEYVNFYMDANTEDPKRVIKFLFDKRFWL